MELTRSGAGIQFDSLYNIKLLEQWESDKIEPSLRALVIVTAMLYYEQGASRVIVKKLLGNTEQDLLKKDNPHYYGCAADISILELVDSRIVDKANYIARRFPKAEWIEHRLNELFPFGDGPKRSCIYNVDHLHLEVPMGGFKKSTQALSTWQEFGACGVIRPPRREKRAS